MIGPLRSNADGAYDALAGPGGKFRRNGAWADEMQVFVAPAQAGAHGEASRCSDIARTDTGAVGTGLRRCDGHCAAA